MGDTSISLDLERRQQDEVNSVASIYGDIFKDITPKGLIWNKRPSPHFQINLTASEDNDRPVLSLTLDIEFTSTYPLSPPIVRILNPRNILKARVKLIQKRIEQLIKEYPEEEIAFTIICEIKDMLDEFQKTTEKVLSLEEEREIRLKNERMQLEKQEALKQKEQEIEKEKQIAELSEQLMKIKGEFDEDLDGSYDSIGLDKELRKETAHQLLIPSDPADYFIFENPMVLRLPGSSSIYKFRAVLGFVRYGKKDLLSSVSRQYVVKPYLPQNIQHKLDRKKVELSFLLTEIDMNNDHWMSDPGKKEIQDLERELQLIMNLSHENIVRLFGFQIDKRSEAHSGWTVRLLTEFSSASETLHEILPAAEFINWSLARNWLIQLLPALEALHNLGFIHKLICPVSTIVFENETEYYYQGGLSPLSIESQDNEEGLENLRIVKLCHPSYAHKVLEMLTRYPNKGLEERKSLIDFMPESWRAPELKGELNAFQLKTDVWDLGVLFIRVMLNYNIFELYESPEVFLAKFNPGDFKEMENYAYLVFDLFSKMLQQKVSKRPSPLELNAIRFLRDGPIITNSILLNPTPVWTDLQTVDNKNKQNIRDHDSRLYRNAKDNALTHLEVPKHLVELKQSYTPYVNKRQPTPMMISSSSLQKNDQPNIGRYERDFEEIGRLGKGGFGEVVKARNRIEGTFYAIKKIKHRESKLDNLMSEVLSLARLNHQYIVRYYGAWVENIDENDTESSSEDNETSSDVDFESPLNVRSSSFLMNNNDSSLQLDFGAHSFDPKIDFDDISFNNHTEDLDDFIEFVGSSGNSPIDDSEETSISKESNNARKSKQKESMDRRNQKSCILYIQMEFCENKTLLNLIEQGLPGNPNEYWRLFRQLLEAVSYIHRSGFIHRDLKPLNIFIDKTNNIKVGDFGLAKTSQFNTVVLENNQVGTQNTNDLSTLVGTVFYTANEVATGKYDEKVDLYSLGIMFFEMCYPLLTGMERARVLNNLRLVSVDFPLDFSEAKYKTEKKIIRLLLDHDPKRRPSATELLQSGWLPVEHQDEVIKEALKSLADPASPWQQQVRETLFNQPYLLVKDLTFENYSKGISHNNNDMFDYLLFSAMIKELFRIFRVHGAIEDYCFDSLLPKSADYASDMVYEVLDRSGSVLNLPFDLVFSTARFLSRNKINIPKFFRHEFVYRPNVRGVGMPNRYSTVGFDIITGDPNGRMVHDAECLKVVDQILSSFPCFKAKNSKCIILINHYDIIDSVVKYSFGNIGLDEKRSQEVIAVLSQLGIDKNAEQIKRYLREELLVPHTVINDLVDNFNFTTEVERAGKKLSKVMKDSPHFLKVERSLSLLSDILSILKLYGYETPILINPLSSYNNTYYSRGMMFQVIHQVDRNRRFSRIITGGRYDSLISSLSSKDIAKFNTPYAVGFSLSSSFMFLLLKSFYRRSLGRNVNSEINKLKWKQNRCDVLVTSLNPSYIEKSGYELMKFLWSNNISSDMFVAMSLDDILQKANYDGSSWIVIIKQPNITERGKLKRSAGKFKPLRIKSLYKGRDFDVDYTNLVSHLLSEIKERDRDIENEDVQLTAHIDLSDSFKGELDESPNTERLDAVDMTHRNVDINQRVTIIANEAPRGRKHNKKEKWELDNDARTAGYSLINTLSTCPIITIDARDETIDMILITSLSQPEEWTRKIVYSNNLPKSFAMSIYNTLRKEASKGTKWVILHSSKTDKTSIMDLQRQ